MKKIIMAVLLLLAGCSFRAIGKENCEPAYQGSLNTVFDMAGKESVTYMTDSYDTLYYIDEQFVPLDLGTMTYADDRKPSSMDQMYFERYLDMKLGKMVYCDKHLYYLSVRMSVEKDIRYFFNAVDDKGENRRQLIELSYVPSDFVMQDGMIVISEEGDASQLHIYNDACKEVHTVKMDGPVTRMFVQNRFVYIPSAVADERVNWILNLDDFSMKQMNNREILLFVNGDRYVTRTLDRSLDQESDPSKIHHTCHLYDLNTDEEILQFENELVGYFDEQYIYTTVLSQNTTVYRVYDYEKNLIKEIIPSESVEAGYETPVMMVNQDFDQILRVVRNSVITGTYIGSSYNYVQCSLDTGKCRVILEEESPDE